MSVLPKPSKEMTDEQLADYFENELEPEDLTLVAETPEETQLYLAAMLERKAQAQVREKVAAARAKGLSWEKIGKQLGISRQAAHQRFAHLTA